MLIYLLFSIGTAIAVPLQITQQGRILDTNGIAIQGTQILTFRVYNQEIGGSILWEEPLIVQFHNGYYSTVLGSDEIGNPLDSDVLSLYPLFLELQLSNNSPMLPRQEINSVPYAQISGKAQSVDGGMVNASEVHVNSIPVIDANRNWVGEPIIIDWSYLQ